MHKGDHEKRAPLLQKVLVLLRSVLFALVICIGLLAVCAALVLAKVLPEGMEGPMIAFSCAFGTFFGGLLGGTGGKRKILPGLLTGVVLFVLLGLLGVIIFEVRSIEKDSVVLGLSCLCGGMLSGLTSMNGGSPQRKGEGRGYRKKR